MIDGAKVTVNLNALCRNALTLQNTVGDFWCVLKSDAYGHGLKECADALYQSGQRRFAVFSLDEALAIRPIVLRSDILILGRTKSKYADLLVKNKCIQTVFSNEYLGELSPYSKDLRVHIKIDSGMNRTGFKCEAERIHKAFLGFSGQVEGVYTHFPAADSEDKTLTEKQLDRFLNKASELEMFFGKTLLRHSAASAAALRIPKSRLDCARIGLALYGILPENCNGICSLEPSMSLEAPIISVHKVKKGESVGYGCDYIADSDRIVATVACGYTNGLSRISAATLRPAISGISVPILGRICMDRCMLDVTQLFDIGIILQPYEKAVFIGGKKTAVDFAASEKTIPYESLVRIGKLNEKEFV